MAALGVYVSLKPQPPEKHVRFIVAFVILFLGGGVVNVIQTRIASKVQESLQGQLEQIRRNTQNPPVFNVLPTPVTILPANPPPKLAQIVLSETKILPFIEGQKATVNMYWTNSGEAMAKQFCGGGKVYLLPLADLSKDIKKAEKVAVDDFKKRVIPTIKNAPRASLNYGTERVFFSAEGPVLSKEDLNGLGSGQKIMYALSAVYFSDSAGDHYIHRCGFLQSPATTTSNWHFCVSFEGQK